mmetsp:Transcript_11620/g.25894  ORF Transcript_11620/g.25894 Transcript_11620/m.25894 type:complete len:296 (-) Transcript_11620:319-1206(-)
MSSKLLTLLQRWRTEVPMQSVPVSPPPITMTSLPSAETRDLSQPDSKSPDCVMSSLFWFLVRNSIAKCTPCRSLPLTSKSLGMVEPTVRMRASWDALRSWMSMLTPMCALVTNSMPSSASKLTLLATLSLSSFMFGMPYISNPPTRSSLSYTVTLWPNWLSWSAAAMPAGPLPTTATLMPVRYFGTRAWIQPSSQARSTIAYSMFLMVTGLSTSPATQAPSQGAGHTRPVNSGKLLVACSLSMAWRHWFLNTSSFHSGIRLFTGQPVCVWQNGVPQSMHRAACTVVSTSSCTGCS